MERFPVLPGLAELGQGQIFIEPLPLPFYRLGEISGNQSARPPHQPFGGSFVYDSPRPPRLVRRDCVLCRLRRGRAACCSASVGAQSSADESQLRDSLKSFTDVYALVEQNYAEPITGDKAEAAIYDGAIPGMLRVLDPHSNFYDPKAYARMREDQRGHYYGVGMVIQQQDDKVYVVTPYEGTPSFRAGIHPGDVIAAVDGKSTDGWTSDQVAKALKGPKGTHVQVTMTRVRRSPSRWSSTWFATRFRTPPST